MVSVDYSFLFEKYFTVAIYEAELKKASQEKVTRVQKEKFLGIAAS